MFVTASFALAGLLATRIVPPGPPSPRPPQPHHLFHRHAGGIPDRSYLSKQYRVRAVRPMPVRR
jgi:hypothetical protein